MLVELRDRHLKEDPYWGYREPSYASVQNELQAWAYADKIIYKIGFKMYGNKKYIQHKIEECLATHLVDLWTKRKKRGWTYWAIR